MKVCNLLHVTCFESRGIVRVPSPVRKENIVRCVRVLACVMLCGLNNLSDMSIFTMCKYSIYMFSFFSE